MPKLTFCIFCSKRCVAMASSLRLAKRRKGCIFVVFVEAKVAMEIGRRKFAQGLCKFGVGRQCEYLCTVNIIAMYNNPNIISADDVQMYQTHGDHIAAVMDTETFIKEYLQKILSESKLVSKVSTDVFLESEEPYVTDVFSLLYGNEDMGISALIATDKAKTSNQFVSAYPVFFGKKLRVKVNTVWVWSNRMEATVECSFKDFTFSFFATDYSANKDAYVPGKEIDIKVGALGLRVEEAAHGFSFEGQQAVDWLAKIGEKPDYDEQGEVVPVKFSTEEMVAFFPLNEKCPEEPEFQSPAGDVSERHFLSQDFWETEIYICRQEFDCKVPLMFRKDMLPGLKPGMPLRGYLWIVGRIY